MKGLLWGIIDLAEEETLHSQFAATGMQDSFAFRHLRRARIISDNLFDVKGALAEDQLLSLIKRMQSEHPPPYIKGANDNEVRKFMIRGLMQLKKKKDLRHLLHRFTMPVANRFVESLVRFSLALHDGKNLETRDLRRSVITALLFPLRQNVGSCFATAPAILIQQEQQERLLIDLYDLIMTSGLKRTMGGVETSVPLSLSWGVGDLRKPIPGSLGRSAEGLIVKEMCDKHHVKPEEIKRYREQRGRNINPRLEKVAEKIEEAKGVFLSHTDHALLKAWEFTLASFSDYKGEFYKWNLYMGLGLDPDDEGGIGRVLHERMQEELDETNKELEKLHSDYVRSVDEVRVYQTLLRQSETREKMRLRKAELETRAYHAQMCKEMFDGAQDKGQNLAGFFSFLIEEFVKQFPEYFQEIYDPEMFEIDAELYSDSPAGFRLVYKHGRRDPTLWTYIRDERSFQKCLVEFFLAIEASLIATCEWEWGKGLIEELVTLLVHHIETDIFIKTAFKRVRSDHPLNNLKGPDTKPWSYTSGGNMNTLLRCYYSIDHDLSEEKRSVESPMDLLIFLLDFMKTLPFSTTSRFEKREEVSMLMNSPTHAFTLRPGLFSFKEGWLDKGFSYTWARDHAFLPGLHFYRNMLIDQEAQSHLAHEFFPALPFSPHSLPLSLPDFRNHFLQTVDLPFPKEVAMPQFDAYLRKSLPLISAKDGKTILKEFYGKAKPCPFDFSNEPTSLLTFYHQLAAAIYSEEKKPLTFDLYAKLDAAFRTCHLLPPPPLLVADTNWEQFYFGFIVNPGTLSLDLWRIDRYGHEGFPLPSWKSYLDGSSALPWGILRNPSEYQMERAPDLSMISKKV